MALALMLSASVLTVNAAEVELFEGATEDDLVVGVDGVILTKGVDYTLDYEDNVQPGVAKVIVNFIGNYSGTQVSTFNIVKKSSGGGGGSVSSSKYRTEITDSAGNAVTVLKYEENNVVVLKFPNSDTLTLLDCDITLTDVNGNIQPNHDVILKDTKGNEIKAITNEEGRLVVEKGKITVGKLSTGSSSSGEPTEPDKPIETPTPIGHTAYIKGYEDGTFKPNNNVTRAETAVMLSRVLKPEKSSENVEFKDVKSTDWYAEAIRDMSASGYIKGYEDNTFKSQAKITRAEFLAILLRGSEVEKYEELPFKDVKGTEWSADYLYTAYKKSLISGYEDNTLRPNAYITRAEAVKIINKYLGHTDLVVTKNPFKDVTESHWAYKDILEATVEH